MHLESESNVLILGAAVAMWARNPFSRTLARHKTAAFAQCSRSTVVVRMASTLPRLPIFEAIKKHDYDVVLMDVSMPFMGGIEATSIIRKYEDSNSLERVPIIALTAHAMTGDREKW